MRKVSIVFVICAVIYSTALIVSNIIAGKLWQVTPSIILTTATLLFPIVYIIGDIIPEVYGIKYARWTIGLAFGANLFAVAFFYLCLYLPAPVFWESQEAFQTVLGFTPRLLLASAVGYLVGSNANALLMVAMKKWTRGKFLWARTISSTIVGESLDTIFFVVIAFFGSMPNPAIVTLVLSMAIFKIVYEIIATPLTYVIVNAVKKYEGIS